MAIRHGIVASSVTAVAPTVSVSSTTNFNENRATFNGTVSANGSTTTVIKFQISTNNSTWTDATGGTTISNTSSQSVSVFYNATGLSVGTLYYVRLVATNAGGTSESSSTTFTTWSLQVYERSTSGGTTFTIPTITPTGGSAVTVSIYDIIMFGAGGGGNFYYGGGGGASYSNSSVSLSGARSITTSVAAGGAGTTSGTGNGSSPTTNTRITGDITTLTAASGYGAGNGDAFCDGASGTGACGGYRVEFDPDGSGKGVPNEAYGGGGGAAANGGSGTANSSTTVGGTGGAGVSITSGGVTRTGGAGGGGAAYINQGTGSQGVRGSNNSYGSGGNSTSSSGGTAGQDGYIRFRYYAASALAQGTP